MLSSTISATSKLPSGSGLATSRMPGWVLPGPFGSFALVEVVGDVDVGAVVGDGEPEGVGPVESEVVGKWRTARRCRCRSWQLRSFGVKGDGCDAQTRDQYQAQCAT